MQAHDLDHLQTGTASQEENTAIGTTIDNLYEQQTSSRVQIEDNYSIGHGSSFGDKSLAHQKSAPIMARNIEVTHEE